jgi:hypothetical protein
MHSTGVRGLGWLESVRVHGAQYRTPALRRTVHTHARKKGSAAEELVRRTNGSNHLGLDDVNYQVLGELLCQNEEEIRDKVNLEPTTI